jgi:hypothetical protein
VKIIVAVSEDAESADAVLRLAEAHAEVIRPCLGLHPIPHGTSVTREMLEEVRQASPPDSCTQRLDCMD